MNLNILRPLYLLFLLVLVSSNLFGQVTKFTISGHIKNDSTGEALSTASVAVKELPGTGVMADEKGNYSLTLKEGSYTLIVQNFGFLSKEVAITLTKDLKMDFTLKEEIIEIEAVEIIKEKRNENITQPQMGTEKIDVKIANKLPVVLGERDIIKTLTLIPGVKSAGEGNGGFFVRGGSADQNLVLMDGATIYNGSHMLGFFSVFNSDAVKDATIYKGNMPAEFGGRLSSVLDVKMSEGNNQKFGVNGGIGLISSRLTVEGPLVKNKGSFIISGRRSYADLFLKLSSDEAIKKTQLNFYDLNAKASYAIDEKNKIYLSGYLGNDILGLRDLFTLSYKNAAGVLRWNHMFNSKFNSNTSLVFSHYNSDIKIGFNDVNLTITTRINDYVFKQDFSHNKGPRNTFKFGFHSTYHRIVPGEIHGNSDQIENTKLTNKNAWENNAYVSHLYKLTDKINFDYGLRLTSFTVLGPGNFYSMDKAGRILDTTSTKSGEFVKTYLNLEPRFAANYVFNDKHSVKGSYARNVQNLHLLSNSTSQTPTDLWIPSSTYVRPEISDQVAVGYYRNFKDNMFQFSTEVYYKNFQSQLDYKNGAQLSFNESVETQILLGKGRAYGIEFLLRKKVGKLTGWIGYTLARTERQFEFINNGKWYDARQDRRHDISVVGMYDLNKKWTLSATWVYYTGNAVTFPSGKYEINGKVVSYYTERNGYRMPSYHRLDLGATVIVKKTEKFESSWTFSIYNMYARSNPYSITFREDPNDPSKTQAVQTTIFQFVPSFSYNFKF